MADPAQTSVKLAAIACAANEADIIEAFVRHTLAVVGPVGICLHNSFDGTGEILAALQAEGLPLTVVREEGLQRQQGPRMLRLLREVVLPKHQPDAVFCLDADEFVSPPSTPFPVEKWLADATANPSDPLVPILLWATYCPSPERDDPSEPNPARRIQHRFAREARPISKVIIPRPLAELPGLQIIEGNHGLVLPGDRLARVGSPVGELAHFPLRWPGQFAAKLALNRLARLAATNSDSDRYRERYRELAAAPSETLNRVAQNPRAGLPEEEATDAELVLSPVDYRGGPLRYTSPVSEVADRDRPLRALLPMAEMLADRVRQQAQQLTQAQADLVYLREESAQLHASLTWRVGRAATAPLRLASRAAGAVLSSARRELRRAAVARRSTLQVSSPEGLAKLRQRYPWPSQRPEVPTDDHGWLHDGTAEVLRLRVPADAAVVLELGSWLGKSLRLLAELAPRATLIAVDHWRGTTNFSRLDNPALGKVPTAYETFLTNCWELRDRIVPVRADTQTGMRAVADAGVVPEVIYVDAGHYFDDVMGDLTTAYAAWPSARIVGDDWGWLNPVGNGDAPVARVVRDFASRHELRIEVRQNWGWWLEPT